MRIFLNPDINIEYSSYYIQGMYNLFGFNNIYFDCKYFSQVEGSLNLNFVTIDDYGVETNYSIDYNDNSLIETLSYKWCKTYAKLNFRKSNFFNDYDSKIIIIAPGYAIRIWSFYQIIVHSILNFFITKKQPLKIYLKNYVKQFRLAPLSFYEDCAKIPSKINYIFSVNTLWNSDEWVQNDNTVNKMRLNFYLAAKSFSAIQSELGFVYSQNKNTNLIYAPFILEKPITKLEYILKTKDSVLVFNTPAWDQCHGWKLAEYLALGKAIISTPFYNELPFPLEHGKHIHFVSGSIEEIQQAIHKIIYDKDYREKLQLGARKYYLDYVQPNQVIKYIINNK